MSPEALNHDDWAGLFVVPPRPSVPDDAQPTVFPDAPLSHPLWRRASQVVERTLNLARKRGQIRLADRFHCDLIDLDTERRGEIPV
jgi:hypothetical protein